MNTATKNLEDDHVNILRLIDVMEKMIMVKSTNAEHFEKTVSLIKCYADEFHHAKEENLLFPFMVKKGYSTEQGPIAVMLHDHNQGRDYVKSMAEGISDYKKGDENALIKVYENMQGYIILLRNHIAKENNVLFRMADNAFSEDDQQELLKEFAKVENEGVCGGVLKDCFTAIEKLESAYK
ncbi:MAG: hemerythrin [Ignavibacteriales bacterium]|nr:MAG: hemerythrin [Ignavibacteriales bacterium]